MARPDGTGVVVVHEDRRTPRAEPTLTLDERTRSARLVAPGLDWTLHVALTDAQPPPPAP
ncbi:MAG: hypothetical protein IT379_18315 [Deltaproteobacteria bacterium]|nr:hypothetical protein [Deltaproteobacteria bacterium]